MGDYRRGSRIEYTPHSAQSYGTLGISGTTFEIGFKAASRLLSGVVVGSTVLDFGAGAGRSSEFLLREGAARVLAIDHNEAMLAEGRSRALQGVEFMLSSEKIPLPDGRMDGAVSLNVFIEFATHESMLSACKEIYRVIRAGGWFIVVTASTSAFGHKFRSFEYLLPEELRSGAATICKLRTSDGFLELEDTYWTEADYTGVLEEAGFAITAIQYPLGSVDAFPDTAESSVAPSLVLAAVKA